MQPSAVIEQISAALSRSSLHHQVIAGNIANRDTQGYQRIKLQFDQAMDAAAAPRLVADTSAGAAVSVERDMIALSTNAAHYQALTRILNRYFSIVSAIASQSRG